MDCFAWQGIVLAVSRRWNPVRLDGDRAAGSALLVDLHRPRLGIRWQRLSRSQLKNARQTARSRMVGELGTLAAAEAKDHPLPGGDTDWAVSMLYTEPDPPGRDHWVGVSRRSNRLIDVVWHVNRRDGVLAAQILPTLSDLSDDVATPWSVFDLTCITPGGYQLVSHRLNAGDLSLSMRSRRDNLIVRQIALAKLALTRTPLKGWIANTQFTSDRFHRRLREVGDTTLAVAGAEPQPALVGRMVRRRRYFFLLNRPASITTLGVHDVRRDRIVILQGADESLLREVAPSVGAALRAGDFAAGVREGVSPSTAGGRIEADDAEVSA